MDERKHVYAEAAEAQRDCEAWQTLLKLADWEIVVKICRLADMDPNNCAQVIYVRSKKQAIIKLLDPQDYDENADYPQDHQKSLIHELIHLHLAFTDVLTEKCREAGLAMEVAVDSLARAFVRQRRSFGEINRVEGAPFRRVS